MLLTKPTINRANLLVGNKNYVGSITIIIEVRRKTDNLGETIAIRYPRAAIVMLRKANRRDHPWQYRRSPGGPSIARGDRPYHHSWSRGTVHVVISSSGGPLLGGPINALQVNSTNKIMILNICTRTIAKLSFSSFTTEPMDQPG